MPIARKVFADTLDGYLLNNPLTGSMHRAAAAELQQLAMDLGLIGSQLSELSRQDLDKLLARALERDNPLDQAETADSDGAVPVKAGQASG